MKKAMLLICLCFSLVNAQESVKIEKGKQIIEEAGRIIQKNSTSSGINGIYLKISSSINGVSTSQEFSYHSPDKLYNTYSSVQNAKSITIWNGNKRFEDYEMILNGKVIRQSVIDAYLAKVKTSGKGTSPDKSKVTEKKANVSPDDSKIKFLENMWYHIFPVILQAPFEPTAQFVYIGKAEAANQQRANIVDVKSDYSKKIRLFFDEKTHLLLMMNVTTDKGNGIQYQERYYYSDYQPTNGLLVAKQIQRESREIDINTKSEKKLGNSFTTVGEFELNPKLSSDLFKID